MTRRETGSKVKGAADMSESSSQSIPDLDTHNKQKLHSILHKEHYSSSHVDKGGKPGLCVPVNRKCMCENLRPSVGTSMVVFAVPLLLPGITLTAVGYDEDTSFARYGAMHVIGLILLSLSGLLLVVGVLLNIRFHDKVSPEDMDLHTVSTHEKNDARSATRDMTVVSLEGKDGGGAERATPPQEGTPTAAPAILASFMVDAGHSSLGQNAHHVTFGARSELQAGRLASETRGKSSPGPEFQPSSILTSPRGKATESRFVYSSDLQALGPEVSADTDAAPQYSPGHETSSASSRQVTPGEGTGITHVTPADAHRGDSARTGMDWYEQETHAVSEDTTTLHQDTPTLPEDIPALLPQDTPVTLPQDSPVAPRLEPLSLEGQMPDHTAEGSKRKKRRKKRKKRAERDLVRHGASSAEMLETSGMSDVCAATAAARKTNGEEGSPTCEDNSPSDPHGPEVSRPEERSPYRLDRLSIPKTVYGKTSDYSPSEDSPVAGSPASLTSDPSPPPGYRSEEEGVLALPRRRHLVQWSSGLAGPLPYSSLEGSAVSGRLTRVTNSVGAVTQVYSLDAPGAKANPS